MIVKTKTSPYGHEVLMDGLLISSIEDSGTGTLFYLLGRDVSIITSMPFDEAEKIFTEVKHRDRMTGESPRKSEQKKFDVVKVGAHKFRLDIRTHEFEDGLSSMIQIYANFNIKNALLKEAVESVDGVERFSGLESYYNKYDSTITIGKLFDAEVVRDRIEQKIKEFLSN